MHALYMCALTLTRMAEGGIYDQLGGGFCRYSVDRAWTIPHFEKMLYDNGPLLALYAWLYQVSGDEVFRRVAERDRRLGAARHALRGGRVLLQPRRGFRGRGRPLLRLDAGRRCEALVTAEEYAVLAPRFGLDQRAELRGALAPARRTSRSRHIAEASGPAGRPPCSGCSTRAARSCSRERNGRVWPGRDEKILTSWNALMIRGLAIAARVLRRPELADAAAAALDFIRTQHGRRRPPLRDLEGRPRALQRLSRRPRLPARRDARAPAGALEHGASRLRHLARRPVARALPRRGERRLLLHVPRPRGPAPPRASRWRTRRCPRATRSRRSRSARLGHLLGETRYLDAAEATLRAAWAALSEYPHGHATLLTALDEYLEPPEIVVLRGEARELAEWLAVAGTLFAPKRLVFAHSCGLPEQTCRVHWRRARPGAARRVSLPGHRPAGRRCVRWGSSARRSRAIGDIAGCRGTGKSGILPGTGGAANASDTMNRRNWTVQWTISQT